jgi:hypothetical protein
METGVLEALIKSGGGVLDGILAYLSGIGEEKFQKMDIDSKLKMAADTLGFNYAALKQGNDQFKQNLNLETDKFLADNKLNKATLAEKVRSNIAGEQLTGQKQQTESRFGLSDRFNQIGNERQQEQRRADIRGSLQIPAEPQVGRPTMAQQPTATAVNKDYGLNIMQPQGQTTTAAGVPTTAQKYIYQPGVAQAS